MEDKHPEQIQTPISQVFNHKLKSSKLLIISIAVFILILFSSIVVYFLNKNLSLKTQNTQGTAKIAVTPTPISNQVTTWKTYTNKTFNYSIDYPSDWIVRDFSDPKSGAAFRPSNMPNEYQYEYISVNKYTRVMLDGLSKPTFEEYIRRAGAEIQNYKDLVKMEKIVTNSGITGYTATYKVAPLGPGKEGISSPRTFFEIPGNNTSTIQVNISNEKYMGIYNKMLLSFKLLEKINPISNPNLKTYNSSKLGIAFTYLEKQGSQEITVKENGNKVCVTYDESDISCSKGQSVEVFQKGAGETLKDVINRLFLSGKDQNRCLVTISTPNNYPPAFTKAEITYPENKEFDLEKMTADMEYCSKDYAQTNGIRYFLEDKNHPTKFLFFSIGQYSISSDANKAWQETISLE
ncbi:MAG: hypothetical protein M1308_21840 [Actinobacteria bacterium]|nr:hypothetical protein [Actinomycetota bacterium]